MTEKEYQSKLEKIHKHNLKILRKQKLKEEKNKYKTSRKLPSTSKLMAVYLFALLNIICVYAMVSMWHFETLEYLGVLITDIASQVIIYFVYSMKSKRENSKGGITYELAMIEKQREILGDVDEEIEHEEDEDCEAVG